MINISAKNSLRKFYGVFILIIIAAAFYLPFLGSRPLENADEATFAIILREMVQSNHYGTMTFFGNAWIDKPPLNFWLMAASSKIFGFNEFAMRLPSAIFGIVAILAVFGIARAILIRERSVFFGASMLLFFNLFLAAARNVRMDVQVAAAIITAVYFFVRGRQNPKFLLGIGPAIGIAIMFKGALGFFIFPIIFIFALSFNNWGWLKNGWFWTGMTLGILVAAPWHIHEMNLLGNNFLNNYLFFQAGRLGVNIINSHISAIYLIWVFFHYGLPWSAALPVAIAILLWIAFRQKSKDENLNAAFRLAIASGGTFAFFWTVFLFSTTRLVTYPIPSYPFLALFFASVYAIVNNKLEHHALSKWINGIIMAVLIIAISTSFREAFLNPKLYVSPWTMDEKYIGEMLSGPAQMPFYIYEWQSDQTLQYYSGRRAKHLTEESPEKLSAPFSIILPTELLEKNPALASLVRYKGKYLSLAEAR